MKCAIVMGSGGIMHAKFHDDWFRHLSNIPAITAKKIEALLLVLLIEGI
jgi:hypothetical protein